MAATTVYDDVTVRDDDTFPAPSRRASALVGGVPTEASYTSFSDKILITLSQGGRLGQWIHLPLSPSSTPTPLSMLPPPPSSSSSSSSSALPSLHLTPRTLLGAAHPAHETRAHLYAAHIGSQLALRDPDERRPLLLGLGLAAPPSAHAVEGEAAEDDDARMAYFDLLELVQKLL